MNFLFPVKAACVALLMGLVTMPAAEAQRIIIDGRRIQVEPSTGGSVILNPNNPGFSSGARFRIDESGNIVSAPGYRCSAATAATDAPIICRSQFNRNDVVVYRRDGQSNTFFVNTDNTVIQPTGSGIRILPNSGTVTPSGSGIRILQE
ncbi:MAG: hypothetical protein Q6L68_13935 [Thermostichus sp. DG02_5_bins_236]